MTNHGSQDSLASERAAFEAWAANHLGRGYGLEMDEGSYADKVTRWAFKAWQARAKLATPAAAAEADNGLQRLRDLAATCYAGLGGECDLPENWLDALSAAANGEPFSLDGLLPYRATPAAAAEPVALASMPELQAAVRAGLENGSLVLHGATPVAAAEVSAPICHRRWDEKAKDWTYFYGTPRGIPKEELQALYAAPTPAAAAEPPEGEAERRMDKASDSEIHAFNCGWRSALAAAAGPKEPKEANAFAEWLAREVPPGTVISDPLWWAPRILRAALASATLATPAAAAEPVVWALRFPHDSRLCLSTIFDTAAEAKEYAERCSPGTEVIPLFLALRTAGSKS